MFSPADFIVGMRYIMHITYKIAVTVRVSPPKPPRYGVNCILAWKRFGGVWIVHFVIKEILLEKTV